MAMRRNKDVYMNYVCPYCFNTVNKCTCELYPPYSLILIDKGIQEQIRILNNKGYATMGCCEGHYKGPCISTYIAFPMDYGFDESIEIPEGFKYHKNRRMIYYDYSQKLTEEAMEMLKKEKLNTLLMWCDDLEERK